MRQSKLVSIIEVCTNVASGFLLAMIVWIFIIPIFWPRMAGPVTESFWITFTFTTVSIARGYFWRRFFANGFHSTLVNWVGKLWWKSKGFPPCEEKHLAAALGNRPCTDCGEDTWVNASRSAGGEKL